MKTIISTITLCLFVGMLSISAQTKRPTLPNDRPIPDPFENLNLSTIKRATANDQFYTMSMAIGVVETPRRANTPAGSNVYHFSQQRIESRGDYIQANPNAFISGKPNSSRNAFRIYVHSKRNTVGQVDKSKIKINWKGSRFGQMDFKLSNVKVTYKPHGIIITGTHEKNGILIGVTLTIVAEIGIQ